MNLPSVPLIRGLSQIVDAYDALLLDQWGMLHGGVEPYPGVLKTLAALRTAGKPVAILSNAPRRSHHAEGRLHKIGVPRDAYDRLVTSGDSRMRHWPRATIRRTRRSAPPICSSARVGQRSGRRAGLLAGEDVADADFLLAVGLFDEADPIERYDPLFAAAAARELAMVCVNPDIVIYRQGGVTAPCAGWLAQHYREGYGGRVLYHGKPDPAIFHRAALALDQGDDARILVVGDSLATDIRAPSRPVTTACSWPAGFMPRSSASRRVGNPTPSAWPKSVRATANVRPWPSPPYAGKPARRHRAHPPRAACRKLVGLLPFLARFPETHMITSHRT